MTIEQIFSAVNEAVEAERQQYAGTEQDAAPRKENGSPLSFPVHIMTGAAGYFAGVLSACMEPPRHFFFIAYLTCLGNILQNTLKTELYPQARLYTVILGESADDRKSTAISKTVSFFLNTISTFKACFGVGSAEGLQRRFLKDASDGMPANVLLVFDELKAFVGKSKVDGSVLLPMVCTLFETNRYESHTKDREIILNNAYLSILAASTIETYERCWDSAFQDIGMTNRLFIVPGQGKRLHAMPGRVPVHEWETMKNDVGKILRAASITPEFDVTPGARALYESWYLNLEQSIHTKRLDTYALRFMILLTVNAGKSEVDESIVQDVIDLMNWQLRVRRLHDPIDADSAVAKVEEKVRRVLGAGPRTDYELKRAVHYSRVGTWVYTNAMRNLTNGREIQFDKKAQTWGLK
jgi:hypothetical protein